MSKKHRQYSAEFKLETVMEGIRGANLSVPARTLKKSMQSPIEAQISLTHW